MATYTEFSYWSPILGCDASRISVFDGHGDEYFMIIERGVGRMYRETRERAVERLVDVMEAGDAPGEYA